MDSKRFPALTKVLGNRQKGKSLPETGYAQKTAKIYRAVLATVSTFRSMDYVALSLKFATEHAQHTAAYEGAPAVVLMAEVSAAQVFEAYNPGEYFYDGPEVTGKIVFRAEPPYGGK